MHYAALASGSKGNCHAFSDGERTLLVDAGLSLKQIRLRMVAVGLDPDSLAAVALTHEHSDHLAGLPVLLRKTSVAFIATQATKAAAEAVLHIDIPANRWIPAQPGRSLDWAGWRLRPFAVPHDASDPVAWRIEAQGRALALVTDLGHPTALVADHCGDLDLLALEANHDVEMLREGPYPPALKARILSRVGHLSNLACAELLQRVAAPRLQHVVLAHLSETNNHPDLAAAAARLALPKGFPLHLAHQTHPMRVNL